MTETDRLVEINKLSCALASGDLKLRDIVERVSKQATRHRPTPNGCRSDGKSLYSLTADEIARRCFIDELLEASAHVPVSVVLTLTGVSLGMPSPIARFLTVFRAAKINLGPMNRG